MSARDEQTICVVIVTVDANTETIGEVTAHAQYGLKRFAEFDGFICGVLHRHANGTRIVQYLRWQSEADHLACMNHPLWDDVPSSRRFLGLVNSGQIRVDVGVYDVIAEQYPD